MYTSTFDFLKLMVLLAVSESPVLIILHLNILICRGYLHTECDLSARSADYLLMRGNEGIVEMDLAV